MENTANLFGVILAGGSGSRLWPLSREMHPKQLLRITEENTLFQSTFHRLANVIEDKNILTVTNVKHSTDIKLQLNEIKTKNKADEEYKVLIEPIGRNTAPAIGLSVLYVVQHLAENGADPVIMVAPSDHLVENTKEFSRAVKEGIKLAENGHIVTFGITPSKPDTGFGYINTEKVSTIEKISSEGVKVKEFKEKPDLATAEKYIKAGNYYWNSGMFLFKASVFLNELKLHGEEIFKKLSQSTIKAEGQTISFDEYEQMPEISIDYAVMEKSKNIALIPFDCGWNDMGSWQAIYETAPLDENQNYICGNVIDIESQNSMVYGTSKLVTTIGLKDTVVVETEDAILVCDKNRTQDVKKIFDKLKEDNDQACQIHKTVYRPWGYYTVLQRGDGFLIKMIQVNPQAKLSLQMHYHRSEHWVVLSGVAKVRKGEKDYFLNPGDSIDIPATTKHYLENPGKMELKIIEVQKGSYLEEDDIVRFEDLYGRVSQ